RVQSISIMPLSNDTPASTFPILLCFNRSCPATNDISWQSLPCNIPLLNRELSSWFAWPAWLARHENPFLWQPRPELVRACRRQWHRSSCSSADLANGDATALFHGASPHMGSSCP